MLVGQPNRATVPLGVAESSDVLYLTLVSEPQSPNLHLELPRLLLALEKYAGSAPLLRSDDSAYG